MTIDTTAIPKFGLFPTHRAFLKMGAVDFDPEHREEAMDWLIKDQNGFDTASFHTVKLDEPRQTTIDGRIPAYSQVGIAVVPTTPVDDPSDTQEARNLRHVRLVIDESAAYDAGFSLKNPLYALGRKVNSTGVENALAERQKFEEKPFVKQACEEFIHRISREARKDTRVLVERLHMNNDGFISAKGDEGSHVRFSDKAFDSLCSRMRMSGGSGYLKNCWPDLRAYNMNQWFTESGENYETQHEIWETMHSMWEDEHARWECLKEGDEPFEPSEPMQEELKFRGRDNPHGEREVYAVVTPIYKSLDCNVIAEAIQRAAPNGARGSIVYDGYRTRFEILLHSNVKADDYGAGEIFRAGVLIRTDDTGNGSIKISSMVERNLCLNLIILDTAEQRIDTIRHIGEQLQVRFHEAFKTALKKIDYFAKQWGFATHDELLKPTMQAANEDLSGLSMRELMAGIINAQAKRELVPVRGRKPDAVRQVLRAYDDEPNKRNDVLMRSDIVNAWTRYAHTDAAKLDAFIEDDIQRAAGRILASNKPLPFEKPEFEF